MKKASPPGVVIEGKLVLQLYVSGMSSKSLEAIHNIKEQSDSYLEDAFELQIIDIYKNPELTAKHSIVFCPSLIKQLPLSKRILIGTLKDSAKVIKTLGVTFRNPE
jgi:circadian clock protein KaiB